jgi:hypothetical protein
MWPSYIGNFDGWKGVVGAGFRVEYFPVIVFECDTCGYALAFSAVKMGIVPAGSEQNV